MKKSNLFGIRARYEILDKFPELGSAAHPPRDSKILDFIVSKTGWKRPSKKNKGLFMAAFLEGKPLTVLAVPVPRAPNRKPRLPRESKKYRKDFYMSDEWRAVRYQVLKKYGATCQCCGATPKSGRQVHVDHIKPRSKHPELELSFSNLQVLCEDCNLGKMHHDDTDWRPDEKEQLPEGAEEHLQSIN